MEERLTLRKMLLTALMTAVTAVLAFVQIPMVPVPVTGQTLGVMLAGGLLGPMMGAVSQVLYLLMGAAGLPVFAGGYAGMGVLFGPTGGYLWSYPLAAAVIGWATAGKGRGKISGWHAFSAMVLGGIGVVYLLGMVQLAAVTGMTWEKAIIAGALPFIPGDLLKAGVAVVVARRLRSLPGMW